MRVTTRNDVAFPIIVSSSKEKWAMSNHPSGYMRAVWISWTITILLHIDRVTCAKNSMDDALCCC